MKLNVLLAKTDHLAASFKKQFEDYIKFFKSSQSAFRGEKKTYDPKPGMIDVPSERGNKLIVTTVDEKLQWLENSSVEYIDALFSQEKTNSSGLAKAILKVEGKELGEFTSLELLKLKSIIESPNFVGAYENIPVRNDDEQWNTTSNEMYKDRSTVLESEKIIGTKKSVYKENYILTDPNVAAGKTEKYTPQIATKDTVIDLGDYSFQKFTGEWSHRQRAEILKRRSTLVTAIIEALKVANEVEAVQSDMTSKKLFDYLHRGQVA